MECYHYNVQKLSLYIIKLKYTAAAWFKLDNLFIKDYKIYSLHKK